MDREKEWCLERLKKPLTDIVQDGARYLQVTSEIGR